ncbi:kinesin-like protein KIF20B, partial [Leptotrombidium deliense]
DGNTSYQFFVSFVEFYNENPIDLLAFPNEQKQLRIYDNGAIQGLKHVFVSTAEEAFRVYLQGQSELKKHINSNGLNLQSSRSHSMFTITSIAINTRTNQAFRVNNLSVCDLAGNERSSKTKSKGDRLKEAGKINTSLLSLQNVVMSLKNMQKNKKETSFVSYRNSKLTRTFKPFLDGSGYASMIINMNPSPNLVDETLTTLEFSATACQIIVSTEDSRRMLQDSWKRLSEQWLSSKKRWSSFAQCRKSTKLNVGDTILEEIEEDEEDMSKIEENIGRLSLAIDGPLNENDLKYYKDMIHILNREVEIMNAKLEDAEHGQFQRKMEIRNEVADLNKKQVDELIQKHANEKETLRRENDEFMEKRLQISHDQRLREKNEYERKIESLEKKVFELTEALTIKETELEEIKSKEFKDGWTSTLLVTINSSTQTEIEENTINSLLNNSVSTLSDLKSDEAKTFRDIACGDVKQYDHKCVATEVDEIQTSSIHLNVFCLSFLLPDQSICASISTSVSICCIDKETQYTPIKSGLSSNSSQSKVFDKLIQTEEVEDDRDLEILQYKEKIESLSEQLNKANDFCIEMNAKIQNSIVKLELEGEDKKVEIPITVEAYSNTSQRELCDTLIQTEEVAIDRDLEILHYKERIESLSEELSNLKKLENEVIGKEVNSNDEIIDSQSADVLENTMERMFKVPDEPKPSISVQTEDTGDEKLQKQLKEKDVIISLKQDMVNDLRDRLKSKEEEMERLIAAASSVASSQQSLSSQSISSYGEPYRSKKPKITLSEDTIVENAYLQAVSNMRKQNETVRKCIEHPSEKKALEVPITKATEKSVTKTTTKSKRKAVEPQEETIDDDIGAAVFTSTGKTTAKSTRGRKRSQPEKVNEELSTTKRMKMPQKDRRVADSISPITEVGDKNQKGPRYNTRSRRKLYD